jgi:hypothetical protein
MNSNERLLKMISDAGHTCMLDGDEIVIAKLGRDQSRRKPFAMIMRIPCTLDAVLTFLGFTEES